MNEPLPLASLGITNLISTTLILGETRAIIFDAGTGQRDIRAVVESLTDLPVTFIPSHLHYDHIGNEVVFEKTALVDLPHLRQRATDNRLPLTRLEHLGEVEGYALPEILISEWLVPNETIDLGNRPLLVLYTPGHTEDSISLFDQDAGYLFSGDFLYPGQLYGFLPNSNMGDYLQGAQTIESVSGDSLRVFGAHRDAAIGVPELNLETVTRLRRDIKRHSIWRVGIDWNLPCNLRESMIECNCCQSQNGCRIGLRCIQP